MAVVAPAGGTGKGRDKGGNGRGPTVCEEKTYSYDTGGSPGTKQPNDPLFSKQWGLYQIKAPEAWGRGARGAGVTIAVTDTGVDLDHSDLKAKRVPGFDFVAGKKDCPPGPQDEHGHGTHVAGIAAATTDNGIGVAGPAPDAKIMPVRVLDEDGSGSLDDVAAGIRWAADQGAQVLNLSLGELPIVGQLRPINEDLEAAMTHAWEEGSPRRRGRGQRHVPALLVPLLRRTRSLRRGDRPPQIAELPLELPQQASRREQHDQRLRRSGGRRQRALRGRRGHLVDGVAEPGRGVPGPGDFHRPVFRSGYETMAGTSMARPFVAGVAALLAGQHLTNAQIVERLRVTFLQRRPVRPRHGLRNRGRGQGHGPGHGPGHRLT